MQVREARGSLTLLEVRKCGRGVVGRKAHGSAALGAGFGHPEAVSGHRRALRSDRQLCGLGRSSWETDVSRRGMVKA